MSWKNSIHIFTHNNGITAGFLSFWQEQQYFTHAYSLKIPAMVLVVLIGLVIVPN